MGILDHLDAAQNGIRRGPERNRTLLALGFATVKMRITHQVEIGLGTTRYRF